MYWCCTAASAGCHVSLRSARMIAASFQSAQTQTHQSKPSVIIFSPIVIPLLHICAHLCRHTYLAICDLILNLLRLTLV